MIQQLELFKNGKACIQLIPAKHTLVIDSSSQVLKPRMIESCEINMGSQARYLTIKTTNDDKAKLFSSSTILIYQQ